MMIEPSASMDGAYWVWVCEDDHPDKFYSSHDSQSDAHELCDRMNAEATEFVASRREAAEQCGDDPDRVRNITYRVSAKTQGVE